MWTTFLTGSADRRGLPREVLPGNRFDLGLEGRYIIGMGMDIKTAQFRGRAPGLWLALVLLAATVGCTTRVSFVRVREPLEQQRIRDVRVVAVLPFRNRSREPGASGLFESAVIAGVQDAFTLADRRNVEAITREQEFNASDLVDPKTRQRIQMTGADTAIVGEVHQYRVSEERGTEPVQQTYVVPEVYFQNGKRLVRYVMRTRTVPAAYLRVTAQVGISLQMIRLSDGTTIVSHSANLSDSDQGGGASSRDIARGRSGGQMLNAMSAAAVQGFLSKVVRTRVTERRVLDKYWGEGVTAAENGDWVIASHYFWERYWRNKQHAGANNNIAVCIEATANNRISHLQMAVAYYKKALELDYQSLYSRNLQSAQALLEEVQRHVRASGP